MATNFLAHSVLGKAGLSRGTGMESLRYRVVHQDLQGGMLERAQGASQDPGVCWEQVTSGWVQPLEAVGLCLGWNPSAVAISEGSNGKLNFHLPTPQMHSLACLTHPSYQNRLPLFSLLCSNCFYTVSNAPQVPSIHNCCYLVKCFP